MIEIYDGVRISADKYCFIMEVRYKARGGRGRPKKNKKLEPSWKATYYPTLESLLASVMDELIARDAIGNKEIVNKLKKIVQVQKKIYKDLKKTLPEITLMDLKPKK